MYFRGVDRTGRNPEQGTSMILMRLRDKNHRKQHRNDNKISSLVNSGTNKDQLHREFCLPVDSATQKEIKLQNRVFSAVEELSFALCSQPPKV